MKIFLDLGHPAHVHYFRNFINIMQKKGHTFLISARDKEVTLQLLDFYQISYTSRGKGRKGVIGKLFYMLRADFQLYNMAKAFSPDIFLSFGSAYAAHVAWILNKPHIAYDDTEHAVFEHLLYVPFTKVILNPSCFLKPFGRKQIFFNGYMELNYLHVNYYKPDILVRAKLKIENNEYIILRFVSWHASHDVGQKGISNKMKYAIIEKLKQDFKIFISSEGKLPKDLEKYRLSINPQELHSILANAYMYIGEGSTTASECAVLGVPNIYVNSLTVGYCKEQEEKYGLCIHLKNEENLLDEINNLLENKDLLQNWKKKKEIMLKEKIDSTAFMIWFIENYPKSFQIMKKNPDYQFNFR